MAEKATTTATKYHCIRCGKIWGDGADIDSYGVCIDCFAEWAKSKMPCFGSEFPSDVNCKFYKYCKEYYGIRQNLSWRLSENG